MLLHLIILRPPRQNVKRFLPLQILWCLFRPQMPGWLHCCGKYMTYMTIKNTDGFIQRWSKGKYSASVHNICHATDRSKCWDFCTGTVTRRYSKCLQYTHLNKVNTFYWEDCTLVSGPKDIPSRHFWDRRRWKSGLSIVIWDCGRWKSGPCLLGW